MKFEMKAHIRFEGLNDRLADDLAFCILEAAGGQVQYQGQAADGELSLIAESDVSHPSLLEAKIEDVVSRFKLRLKGPALLNPASTPEVKVQYRLTPNPGRALEPALVDWTEVCFALEMDKTTSLLNRRFGKILAKTALTILAGMMAACGSAESEVDQGVQSQTVVLDTRPNIDPSVLEKDRFYDPELQQVMFSFIIDAATNGVKLDDQPGLKVVKYADRPKEKSENTLAVCVKFTAVSGEGTSNRREIKWREVHVYPPPPPVAKYSEFDLNWIMYHELGHCLLGKDHRDDAQGIMSPYVALDTVHTQAEWTELKDELFSPAYLGTTKDVSW